LLLGCSANGQNIQLDFQPKNIITEIGYNIENLSSGEKAFNLHFVIKSNKTVLGIRSDSFTLVLSDGMQLNMSKSVNDTIFFLQNGDLSINATQRIDEKDFQFLKRIKIKDIVFYTKKEFIRLAVKL